MHETAIMAPHQSTIIPHKPGAFLSLGHTKNNANLMITKVYSMEKSNLIGNQSCRVRGHNPKR